MIRSKVLVLSVSLGVALCMAQDKAATSDKSAKKSESKTAMKGVLQPQMKLSSAAGSYDAPMGKLGDKPAEAWSATTVEAAIDKKPNSGKIVTVTGEIVDFSCYMQVGKHGEAHEPCGKKCLANGQPMGLVDKSGNVYVLMEEEHHPRRDSQTSLRDAATTHMGHVMEVSGTESVVAGQKAIFVSGFIKK
jgi:hypothetical protein